MRCPFCPDSHPTQVIETRESDEGDAVRRRRRCVDCGKRFTTFERIELVMPAVVKKNGSREEFERQKLERSIRIALRKRPVSTEQVDLAIQGVIDSVLSTGLKEITSEQIGELIMQALKSLDNVGYIRFASVYRSFEDVDEFTRAVAEVERK